MLCYSTYFSFTGFFSCRRVFVMHLVQIDLIIKASKMSYFNYWKETETQQSEVQPGYHKSSHIYIVLFFKYTQYNVKLDLFRITCVKCTINTYICLILFTVFYYSREHKSSLCHSIQSTSVIRWKWKGYIYLILNNNELLYF